MKVSRDPSTTTTWQAYKPGRTRTGRNQKAYRQSLNQTAADQTEVFGKSDLAVEACTMSHNRWVTALNATLTSLLLLGSAPVWSEDIDLFKGGGSLDPSPPNVLIILDNTSNWSANNQAWKKTDVSAKCYGDTTCLGYVQQIFGNNSTLTQGQVEVASLKLVLNELVCNASATNALKINVGIMLIKPTKGAYSTNAGLPISSSAISGFLLRAVSSLDATRCATLLSDLDAIFGNITSSDFKADAAANYGGPFFDAFKYFGGHTNPANAEEGTAGTPTGHISFGPKRYSSPIDLEEALAFTDSEKLTYRSPIVQNSQTTCGYNNYILLIGNGIPNADDTTLLKNLGYGYTPSQFAFPNNQNTDVLLAADVWSKFLATTDVSPLAGQQSVATSVMNIYNASADADQTKLLKSMAKYGGGSYYEVGGSLGGLINSFKNFFTSINAANQAFASSTLPSTLTGGGLDLNQVYLGMFRPDKNPRWYGNLKHYQYILTKDADGEDTVILGDSRNPPQAVQSGSGFIVDKAVSFWTHSSSFWTFRCDSNNSTGDPLLCGSSTLLTDAELVSDSPDGAVVEKGGAGQILRDAFQTDAGFINRKVFTDNGTNGTALIAFNTTNVTTTLLGVSTTTERDAIVNWARGVDNIGENTLTTNGPRPSITGDILHSEPVAVNYGVTGGTCSSGGTGDVVVYYAGNDGFLHAIKGGQTEGEELWSYMPRDFLGVVKRLRDNTPAVTFPAPVPATAFNKPYTIDGSLTVYAPDANNDCRPDKVWLFITLRRGGRILYALDVTDRNNPRLLWRNTHTTSGFTELGQSWSRLKPILLPDNKPYLIFGAGYDPAAEDRPFDSTTGTYGSPSSGTRTMGRGVFILDAETGAVEEFLSAGNYSIPSDVAVIANPQTGFAERAYVGDTGGDLWKITLPANVSEMSDSSNWTAEKIASLGPNDPTDTSKTTADARAFLYPPDVARCGGQEVLLIGSGDREKPFDRAAQNRFFMLKSNPGQLLGAGDLTDVTTTPITAMPANGWYLNLETGEKTVGGAISKSVTMDNGEKTVATFFPTNKAADNSGSDCSNSLGTARLYAVDCATGSSTVYGTSRFEVVPGGGFPPSPVASVVKLTDEDGVTKTYQVISSGTHVAPSEIVESRRKFTYWYRDGLD